MAILHPQGRGSPWRLGQRLGLEGALAHLSKFLGDSCRRRRLLQREIEVLTTREERKEASPSVPVKSEKHS